MTDKHTLSFQTASDHRSLRCEECSLSSVTTAAQSIETAGVMFRLQTVQADDPLQLPVTSFHHITCLSLVILQSATPTGSIERINGYVTLPNNVKSALHAELLPLLRRAVDVIRDVEANEFIRHAVYYVHQQRISQLQCKQCDRMLLDAVELPCCPAYQLCSLCWKETHLSSSVQVDMGGCNACGKLSSPVTLVSCPSCKRSVEVAKVVEDQTMRVRVEGKLVRCCNEKQGCEAVMKAKDALDHLEHCPHETAKRTRQEEREMDTDSEEEDEEEEEEEFKEDEEVEGWEEVSVGSGSDGDMQEDDVEQKTQASDPSATGRTISFASPLVTLAVVAPSQDNAATAEVATMEEAQEVAMFPQQAVSEQGRSAQLPIIEVAADGGDNAAVDSAASTILAAQEQRSNMAVSSKSSPCNNQPVDGDWASLAHSDGVTPLVSVTTFGHTMAPALLQLRQQNTQQLDQQRQPPSLLSTSDEVTQRRAGTEEATNVQYRKRVKTEMLVVE